MSFELYPAIDLRGGRVVRLRQGDYGAETHYADDPLPLIEAYAEQGARWLHLVDLDAARAGGFTLAPLIARIKQRCGLRVQAGGGVRRAADVEAMLDAGVDRAVLGTLAIRQPDTVLGLFERHGGERLTLAFDVRADREGGWRLPSHGWTADDAPALPERLEAYRGSPLQHVLSTDIGCDGMLSGPNLALYRWWRQQHPTLLVQASGGVRDGADVAALRALGVAGAVLGRSLLEGRMKLAEVLTC